MRAKRCAHRKCDRKTKAKGFCSSHYNQFRQFGTTFDLAVAPSRLSRKCQADTCEVSVYWDYCGKHRGACSYPLCESVRTERTEWCKRHQSLDSAYRSKFGQSLRERLERIEQDPTCAICGGKPDTLHLDHDHETEDIRDFLCGPCNRALGLMQDDPARLRAAADYLELHKTGRL